jgi:hypothetical protein
MLDLPKAALYWKLSLSLPSSVISTGLLKEQAYYWSKIFQRTLIFCVENELFIT